MQHSQLFIWFRKSNKDFSYTIFPVKKLNVGKVLKLWENCYLIFFLFTSWNWKFQSVTTRRVPVPRTSCHLRPVMHQLPTGKERSMYPNTHRTVGVRTQTNGWAGGGFLLRDCKIVSIIRIGILYVVSTSDTRCVWFWAGHGYKRG
jgi:hypothetical protein